ncbi:unnamed protein product [Alopecurus aequalis]
MVDAVGGVAKIVGVALKIKEAANTVHQNKKDCHHIKSRVDILNRTLSHHENNTELVEDSAVMAALEALDGILAEALEVITKCQEPRNIICVYYTAGNLSRKLSKVEQRISYLSSDVMLTIMSYQLLRKCQEGAPHPPRQAYALGTHTPLQPPSPPQKMSKKNQDKANKKDPTLNPETPKFGEGDAVEHKSFTVQFDRVREPRKMSKQNQDEANKKDQSQRPQVPKFVHLNAADQRVGYVAYFDSARRPRRDYEPGTTSKQNQDEANKKDPAQAPRLIPKFGGWDATGHTKQAEGNQIFMRLRDERRTVVSPHSSSATGSVGEMTGQPRNLVHRIAEVTRNIKEAVEMVLQHRDECAEIGKRANKVSALLPQLEDTKMLNDPVMRGALEKLITTFLHAHTLVIACQRRSLVIAWFSTPPGRLSRQLHEVMEEITSNIADMTAIVLP